MYEIRAVAADAGTDAEAVIAAAAPDVTDVVAVVVARDGKADLAADVGKGGRVVAEADVVRDAVPAAVPVGAAADPGARADSAAVAIVARDARAAAVQAADLGVKADSAADVLRRTMTIAATASRIPIQTQ
jgi:hypothetical protein